MHFSLFLLSITFANRGITFLKRKQFAISNIDVLFCNIVSENICDYKTLFYTIVA